MAWYSPITNTASAAYEGAKGALGFGGDLNVPYQAAPTQLNQGADTTALLREQLGMQPVQPQTKIFGGLLDRFTPEVQVDQNGFANTAAQQQLRQGVQTAQQAALGSAQGVRGVAPGIAQALAARQAAGIGAEGSQMSAILQAQERAAAEQQLLQASMMEQQLALQQTLAQAEHDRQVAAAQMAQRGNVLSGALGVAGMGLGFMAGGPMGMMMGGQLGRMGGGAVNQGIG